MGELMKVRISAREYAVIIYKCDRATENLGSSFSGFKKTPKLTLICLYYRYNT